MANPDNISPILEFDELVEIFGYTNERAARRALRLGKFPVKTFELAGRTVAHVDVVNGYFEAQKEEGLADPPPAVQQTQRRPGARGESAQLGELLLSIDEVRRHACEYTRMRAHSQAGVTPSSSPPSTRPPR